MDSSLCYKRHRPRFQPMDPPKLSFSWWNALSTDPHQARQPAPLLSHSSSPTSSCGLTHAAILRSQILESELGTASQDISRAQPDASTSPESSCYLKPAGDSSNGGRDLNMPVPETIHSLAHANRIRVRSPAAYAVLANLPCTLIRDAGCSALALSRSHVCL